MRHEIIGDEFNSGKTAKAIMSEYNIKTDTFLDHLLKYGNLVAPVNTKGLSELLECSSKEKEEVLKLFNVHGVEFLRPVFDAMKEKVSFLDLKIIRLEYIFKS